MGGKKVATKVDMKDPVVVEMFCILLPMSISRW